MELFKPEFGLVFWMLIVFLIILGILAKFAWPVIIRSIEERADFIDSGVKYTQDAVRKLDEAKEQARLLIEEAHKQQVNTLQETERMRQKMIEEATEARHRRCWTKPTLRSNKRSGKPSCSCRNRWDAWHWKWPENCCARTWKVMESRKLW